MGGLVRATWRAVSTTNLSAATIQVGRHKTCGSLNFLDPLSPASVPRCMNGHEQHPANACTARSAVQCTLLQ
jgi:hypothetical protein